MNMSLKPPDPIVQEVQEGMGDVHIQLKSSLFDKELMYIYEELMKEKEK